MNNLYKLMRMILDRNNPRTLVTIENNKIIEFQKSF